MNDDPLYVWQITGEVPEEAFDPEQYVPSFMQPFTPYEYELPEIPGMKVIKDKPQMGGRHVTVEFRNGWQVSIINHWGAFGGLEVGFLLNDELVRPPFHDDEVMGYLDRIDLIRVLTEVHQLPKETP